MVEELEAIVQMTEGMLTDFGSQTLCDSMKVIDGLLDIKAEAEKALADVPQPATPVSKLREAVGLRR